MDALTATATLGRPAALVGDLGALVLSLALPLAVAGIGGAVTVRALDDWYPRLRKPSWNPPNRVFGPVWTVLYVLMGLALWRVWQGGLARPGADLAVWLFLLQLALNLGWSAVFFGLRRPGAALVVIGLLWAVIAATAVAFYRLDPPAGWLMLPYLAWVSFAAALNAAVWWLNRGGSPG
jgi:tryptophan-rich sensory protein